MHKIYEIPQWRGTVVGWNKNVYSVATRVQLIDHGQGQCKRIGMVLQAVPSLGEGFFFPDINFSKPQ